MNNDIKNILCHLKSFLDLTYCVFFIFFLSRDNFLISYTKPCYHPQPPTISHNYPISQNNPEQSTLNVIRQSPLLIMPSATFFGQIWPQI